MYRVWKILLMDIWRRMVQVRTIIFHRITHWDHFNAPPRHNPVLEITLRFLVGKKKTTEKTKESKHT